MVDVLKKKQTITSTALRLGTFRLVFSGSFFFHILEMDNGIIDLWDPSTWTALWKHSSVKWSERPTKIPLGMKFALCVITKLFIFPLRVRSQGFDEAKYQLGWLDLLL